MKNKVLVFGVVVIGIVVLIVSLLSMQVFKGNQSVGKVTEDFNGEIKEFNIIAKSWEFIPSIIEVNKGDKVILNIESIDVTHGISISEFGIREYLNPRKSITLEFIADKSGEFSFFCNVYCGNGHGSMNGILIVN